MKHSPTPSGPPDDPFPALERSLATLSVSTKKKKKQKKNKGQSKTSDGLPNPEQNIKFQRFENFIVASMAIKANFANTGYTDLYEHYKDDIFDSNKSTINTIITIPHYFKTLPRSKTSDLENLKSDLSMLNVSHFILDYVIPLQGLKNDPNAKCMLYSFWHKVFQIYSDIKGICEEEMMPLGENQIYYDALFLCFSLIEHYADRFRQLLDQALKDKTLADQLYHLNNLGLWYSNVTLLKIDFYQCGILYALSRQAEGERLSSRFSKRLTELDKNKSQIRKIDTSKIEPETDLVDLKKKRKTLFELNKEINGDQEFDYGFILQALILFEENQQTNSFPTYNFPSDFYHTMVKILEDFSRGKIAKSDFGGYCQCLKGYFLNTNHDSNFPMKVFVASLVAEKLDNISHLGEKQVVPTLEDFYQEISQVPANIRLKVNESLQLKYQHLFTPENVSTSIEVLITRCLSISLFDTTEDLQASQRSINIYFYLLHVIMPQYAELQELRYKLMFFLQVPIFCCTKKMVILLTSEDATLEKRYYEKYYHAILNNYQIFSAYKNDLLELIEFTLNNGTVLKDPHFINVLNKALLTISQGMITINVDYYEILFYLFEFEKAEIANTLALEALEYTKSRLKPLCKASKVGHSTFSQALQDLKEKIQNTQSNMTIMSRGKDSEHGFTNICSRIDGLIHPTDSIESTVTSLVLSNTIKKITQALITSTKEKSKENPINILVKTLDNLPQVNTAYDVSDETVSLFKNAAFLCRLWANCFDKKRSVKDRRADLLFPNILIEKLERLSDVYFDAAESITKLLTSMPARSLITRVQSVTYGPDAPELQQIFLEFRGTCFQNDEAIQKTVREIVGFISSSSHTTPRAKLNIVHFLLQVLPLDIRHANPHLYTQLSENLYRCCSFGFNRWFSGTPIVESCHILLTTLEKYLSLYKHYVAVLNADEVLIYQKYEEILAPLRPNFESQDTNSSDLMTLYRTLTRFEVTFEEILTGLKVCKASNDVTVEVASPTCVTTPLTLLEDVLSQASRISLNNVESIITAFKELSQPEYHYEINYFLNRFVVLCSLWRSTSKVDNKLIVEKLISEKLEDFACKAARLFEQRHDVKPPKRENDLIFEEFIKKAGSMEALQSDELYPALFDEYQATLFNSRCQAFLTMNHFISHYDSAELSQMNINVAHFLISFAIPRFTLQYGAMNALSNQLVITLWRALNDFFIDTGDALYQKTVTKGTYTTICKKIENNIKIVNAYLPLLNGLLSQWDNQAYLLDAKQQNSVWTYYKTLVVFQKEYANVLVSQWNLHSAKSALKKAKENLKRIRKHHSATTDIERLGSYADELKELEDLLYDQHATKRYKALNSMGLILKKITVFEKKLPMLLTTLRYSVDFPQDIGLGADTINYSGFVSLLGSFQSILVYPHRCHAKDHLKRTIALLEANQSDFQSIKDEALNERFIVELVSEKLENIIAQCKQALPHVIESKMKPPEVTPIDQLAERLSQSSLGTSPVITLGARPKPAVVNKEKPMPQEVMNDLLCEAQEIKVSHENIDHFLLYESYKEYFTNEKSIKYVIGKALELINDPITPDQLDEHQKKINLGHFVLEYIVAKLKDVSMMKLDLLKGVWQSLHLAILHLTNKCIENQVEFGRCQQNVELLAHFNTLYDYYILKHEIAKNTTGFARLEAQVKTQTIALIYEPPPILEALCNFKVKLGKITQIPNEPSQDSTANNSLSKELKKLTAFNVDNIYRSLKLFSKLLDIQDRSLLADQLTLFASHFNLWFQSASKSKSSFQAILVIEKLQEIINDCNEIIIAISTPRASMVYLQEHAEKKIPEVEEVAQRQEIEKSQQQASNNSTILRMKEIVDTVAPFVPKPAQPAPGSRLYTPPPAIVNLFHVLRACPHVTKARLVGGAPRDHLFQMKPNDYDIFIEADVAKMLVHFPDAYQPSPKRKPELVRLTRLDCKNIKHDIICLKPCSIDKLEPDLTINSFAWEGDLILDPLGKFNDIYSDHLEIIGEPADRFKKDPCIVLRLIKQVNMTKKSLHDEDWDALKEAAPTVTTLEMGVYLSNLAALFLRSLEQAHLNLDTIFEQKILSCLLPPPLCAHPSFITAFESKYFHQQLLLFYTFPARNFPSSNKINEESKYELLSLFLRPLFISRKPTRDNYIEIINQVVEEYCNHYAGFNTEKFNLLEEVLRAQKITEINADKVRTAYKLKTHLCAFYFHSSWVLTKLLEQPAPVTPLYQHKLQSAKVTSSAKKIIKPVVTLQTGVSSSLK